MGGLLLCFINLFAISLPFALRAEENASQPYTKLQQPADEQADSETTKEQASTKEWDSLSPAVRWPINFVLSIFFFIICCIFITLLATVIIGPISLPYIALSVAQKVSFIHSPRRN
jgi:hypothetical protein